MKIAIASGKGGTGKSTISTNLAYLLSKSEKNIALVDCDVEEPNCHIFLKPSYNDRQKTYITIPKINSDKCIKCGKCAEVCQFNALAFVQDKVLLFSDLCHGCESCKINCPANAIEDDKRNIGEIESGKAYDFYFIQGKSRIGEAMSSPLIKATKKYADLKDINIQILDCPPGTSCPVISAVNGVTYVILVTEPTPFGFNDLKLAVGVMRKMNLPFGIVINRSSENDKLIENWATEEKIDILTKIPDSIEVAKCYSKGQLILEANNNFEKYFTPLIEKLKELKR